MSLKRRQSAITEAGPSLKTIKDHLDHRGKKDDAIEMVKKPTFGIPSLVVWRHLAIDSAESSLFNDSSMITVNDVVRDLSAIWTTIAMKPIAEPHR